MDTYWLIGLGGYAHAGKDAVADYLRDSFGFFKTYMSEPLERALLILNPQIPLYPLNWKEGTWPQQLGSKMYRDYRWLHALVGYDHSKNNYEVRRLLQVLGTEIGRKMFDEDVWINLAFGVVDRELAAGKNVAITGIRYANELASVESRNGVSVWVERPGYGPVNDHSSDNTLSSADFEYVIDNDGTLEDLYDKVARLVDDLVASRTFSLGAA